MSLTVRTEYFNTLITKTENECQPYIDMFNNIEPLHTSAVNSANASLTSLEMERQVASTEGNDVVENELSQKIDSLGSQITDSLNESIGAMSSSIELAILGIINSADGLTQTLSITVPQASYSGGIISLSSGVINLNITSLGNNVLTDFVEDTITSPETKVNIPVAQIGNSSDGATVLGNGAPCPPITTT